MASNLRPWTFVVSEYLDLPFMLRRAGEPVVSVRSVQEALACLQYCCPTRVVVDTSCPGHREVVRYVQTHCPHAVLEPEDQVIDRLLAS